MSKAKQAAELAAVLSEEWHRERARLSLARWMKKYGADVAPIQPHQIAADALALLRIGASVSRWAVRACNGEGHRVHVPRNGLQGWSWEWGSDDEAAKDKADARALKRASEIAARYGATVEIGGDPRGFVLRLHLASGRKNGCGEGWGVA